MDIEKLFEETIPKFSEEYKDFVWSMMPIKFDDFYFIVATDILDYTLGIQKEETAHIKEYKKFFDKYGDCHSKEYFTICFHNWFELKYGYEVSRIQY